MKYLLLGAFLFWAFSAVAGEPDWTCESMTRWRLAEVHLDGLKKTHGHVVQDLKACPHICKALGCHEKVRICWTDDPVAGKTKQGQRFMECE